MYSFIWEYVQEHEALPPYRDVSAALGLGKEQVATCACGGKITPAILLPRNTVPAGVSMSAPIGAKRDGESRELRMRLP